MATDRLWMPSVEACYVREFDATVTSVDGDRIELDRTAFYPMGGGQPWDLGRLEGPTGGVNIASVRGREEVQHEVEHDHGLEVGDAVRGHIDWDRRHAHMRMHTAQHLISGLAYEMFEGARTVGNQIGADRSRIDLNPIRFEGDMVERLVETANARIRDDLPVRCDVLGRSEINAIMPPDRTAMNLVPTSVDQLRVIRIGNDVDLCPCAGTHVRSLAEIGTVEPLGTSSKGKGTQRFRYELS